MNPLNAMDRKLSKRGHGKPPAHIPIVCHKGWLDLYQAALWVHEYEASDDVNSTGSSIDWDKYPHLIKRIATVHVPGVDLNDPNISDFITACWFVPKPTTEPLNLLYWNLNPTWEDRHLLQNVCHTVDCVNPPNYREGRLRAQTRHNYPDKIYLPNYANRPRLTHWAWQTSWLLRFAVTTAHKTYALSNQAFIEEMGLNLNKTNAWLPSLKP